jgi:hypothetical protein
MSYRGRKRRYEDNNQPEQSQGKFQVENATFYFGGVGVPSIRGRGAPKRGRGGYNRGRGGHFFSGAGPSEQSEQESSKTANKFVLTDEEALDLIPLDLKSELPQFNLDILVHKLKQTNSEKSHNDLVAVAYEKMAELAESRRRVREAQKKLKDAKIKPKLSKREDKSNEEGTSSTSKQPTNQNENKEDANNLEGPPDYIESGEESGKDEMDQN